jgi:uncharacterized repeat protein (TIGR03803 family)
MVSNPLTTAAVRLTAAFAFVTIVAGSISATSTEQIVYNFSGNVDGGNAATALVFDKAGNAYGTTVTGGKANCGTVFELTPVKGGFRESVLFSFGCSASGKAPHGGVTRDAAGNLYGTTVAGGSGGACTGDGCGLVFEISGRAEKILYNFTGKNDGFGPGGALVFDKAGNLYGTAPDGGTHGAGTVFQLSPSGSNWKFSVIHDFDGGAGGGVGSLGPLLLDKAGNVYGVTEIGGAYGAGLAYKLALAKSGQWPFASLYDFKGAPDAASPYGGLTPDGSGNLFGTTYYGGARNTGSVFELSPSGGTYQESVVYNFRGGMDGSAPTSALLIDSARNLYGTTSAGGGSSCDCGTVFKLSAAGKETVLHRFGRSSDGSYPYYGMTPDAAGNLFGSTVAGGLHNQGTIFKLRP